MARQATIAGQKPNVIVRARQFLQEVKTEMNKVAWPSKDDVKSHTSVVLFLLFVLAGVIYVYDIVFLQVVKLLLLLG
jgi:preprotein translocase subunit SecE